MVPSSFGPKSGDRGRAINPVRADSKMPKGETSFMKESILVGFADLGIFSNDDQMVPTEKRFNLHFNDAAVRANIQDLSSKLMREICDGLQMFMLVSQCLTNS
jgi:hypothetical protein